MAASRAREGIYLLQVNMFLYGKKSGVELLVGITVFIHCFYPSFGDIFEQRFQCGAFSGKSSPTFAGKRKAEAYRPK